MLPECHFSRLFDILASNVILSRFLFKKTAYFNIHRRFGYIMKMFLSTNEQFILKKYAHNIP